MERDLTSKLWTVREVADYLNVDTKTVYAWKDKGILPYIQLTNGAIRFNPDTIMQWVESKKRDIDSDNENIQSI